MIRDYTFKVCGSTRTLHDICMEYDLPQKRIEALIAEGPYTPAGAVWSMLKSKVRFRRTDIREIGSADDEYTASIRLQKEIQHVKNIHNRRVYDVRYYVRQPSGGYYRTRYEITQSELDSIRREYGTVEILWERGENDSKGISAADPVFAI